MEEAPVKEVSRGLRGRFKVRMPPSLFHRRRCLMPRILIVYGTTYGQAERLAGRLASGLRDAGCTVDMHRGDRLPAGLGVESYDGVVVAASVLMGHHQRYIRD